MYRRIFTLHPAVVVHRIHECANMLRRRELRNTMPEVEDVSAVRRPEAVEHRPNFAGDGVRRRKQYIRIQIALQGHPRAHAAPRRAAP